MEEKKKRYRPGKWSSAALVFLAIVVFLFLGINALIQSDWFFDKISDIAEEQVNMRINGNLEIGEIRGDLRSGFVIYNVNLKDNESVDIFRSDSISVEYHWTNLIRAPFQIDKLDMHGVYGSAVQEPDSTWNIMQLLKESERDEDPESEMPYWDIREIQISGLYLDITSEILLPDGNLSIEELDAGMSAGFGQAGFYGFISSLEFKLNEARLPENIGIELSGQIEGEKITLESLLLDSGRSYLKAAGKMDGSGELSAEATLSPISWEDLILYAEDLPLRKNLNLSLSVNGRLDDLKIQLNAEADGLKMLQLHADIQAEESFSIRSFRLDLEELNLPILTGESDWPLVESVQMDGEGVIDVESPESSRWTGNAEITGLVMPDFQLDRFETGYEWDKSVLDLTASLYYQDQAVEIAGSLSRLFEERPQWNLIVESDAVNLAIWLDDPEMESQFRIHSDLSGHGFSIEDFDMEAVVLVSDIHFREQNFKQIAFEGSVNPDTIIGAIQAEINESKMVADVIITEWNGIPDFEFTAGLDSFNIAEIVGYEEFPTGINGSLSGYGSGNNLENLELFAEVDLDSSIVNGEMVEQFNADLRIENSYLYIDEGLVRSPIADATLTLRQHLSEFKDPDNRLIFMATLKDLSSLAPLFGLETLSATGEFTGRLSRNPEGILGFIGETELENVVLDTLFHTDEMTGSLEVLLRDEPVAELQVLLKSPRILDRELRDLNLNTSAVIGEEATTGDITVNLSNGDESSLQHAGQFVYRTDDIWLHTTGFTFQTGQRTLALTKPFDLYYRDQVLKSDTLSIATEDLDSRLSLWIPHLDSLEQHIGIDADNLNLGILQKTVIDRSYFDGFLSGKVELHNSAEDLAVSATGYLKDFRFEEGEMDSLHFDVNLSDEWLDAGLSSWHDDRKLLESSIRVPYLPGDPLTFDDQFFERSIEGQFELLESNLSYWLSFLPEGGPEQTEGILSINLDLSGIAGSPELTGNLNLNDGILSGVRIDRLGVNLDYQHAEGVTLLNGHIIKDQRQILDFDTNLPFMVDLRQAEIILPSDEDEIFATLKTNDFDLAIFNNYLDPDRFRNVAGRLEGDLEISGEFAELKMDGTMNLTRGAIRIVPAGINLTEIRSTVIFEPEKMNLQEFRMRSGPGTFRASGDLDLENLKPGNMNIELEANQFRVANTSDFSAIVNSSARISGDTENPVLSGSLTFLNGFLNLQNFGERSVETVVLDEEEEEEPFEFFENLSMEMDINFSRQFLLRNRQYLDMEIELGGQVDLLKQKNEDIQIFGTLEGVQGYARPLGKNFELEEAILSFSGPMENPELNIVTKYEPPQAVMVTIYYIIDGTLQDPQFRFNSTPELELQDIISYTLFGKPFYELESWEQVVAGSGSSPSAADFALDVLLDRVEMIASQRLGIDVVQIDNTRSGSSNTTSIKTGWYLNRRTFFAILNEVGGSRPKTLFLIEYLLTENLELIIMQGDDSREGIDIRWRKDY